MHLEEYRGELWGISRRPLAGPKNKELLSDKNYLRPGETWYPSPDVDNNLINKELCNSAQMWPVTSSDSGNTEWNIKTKSVL